MSSSSTGGGDMPDEHQSTTPTTWRIDLSGGGVRAALASLGALYYLRKNFPTAKVSTITSVSGGSLVNAALMVDPTLLMSQQSTSELDRFVAGMYRRLRMNWQGVAEVIALLGVGGMLLLGSLGTGELLDRYWVVIGTFVIIWIVALVIVKRVLAPLALCVGAFVIALADVTQYTEDRVAQVLLTVAVSAAAALGVVRAWQLKGTLGTRSLVRGAAVPTVWLVMLLQQFTWFFLVMYVVVALCVYALLMCWLDNDGPGITWLIAAIVASAADLATYHLDVTPMTSHAIEVLVLTVVLISTLPRPVSRQAVGRWLARCGLVALALLGIVRRLITQLPTAHFSAPPMSVQLLIVAALTVMWVMYTTVRNAFDNTAAQTNQAPNWARRRTIRWSLLWLVMQSALVAVGAWIGARPTTPEPWFLGALSLLVLVAAVTRRFIHDADRGPTFAPTVVLVAMVTCVAAVVGWGVWNGHRQNGVPVAPGNVGTMLAAGLRQEIVLHGAALVILAEIIWLILRRTTEAAEQNTSSRVTAFFVWFGGLVGIDVLFVLLDHHRVSGSIVFGVVGLGLGVSMLGPQILRSYLGRVIGDPWRRLQLGDVSGDTTHVFCTTDLRNEGPAFFIAGGSKQAKLVSFPNGLTVQQQALAERVKLVSVAQASAGAIPSFAPLVPLGTRRIGEGRCIAVQPLMDGGLVGTLGTQYDGYITEATDAATSPTEARLVVDTTRRRRAFHLWPLILVPKVGQQFLLLSSTHIMLGSLVDAERRRLATEQQSNQNLHYAMVSGAEHQPAGTDPYTAELQRLRRRVDRTFHWWPSAAKARDCVLGGYAAVFDAMRQGGDLTDLGRQLDAELEQLSAVLRGRRAASYSIGPRPGRRPSRLLPHGTALAAVFIALTAVATYREEPADACRPVCIDQEQQHPFFGGLDFIAVSHEGLDAPGPGNAFEKAYSLGFRYFETDLSMTTDGRIVAYHKGGSSLDPGKASDAPSLPELLALTDSHWFFELNSPSNRFLNEFIDQVLSVDPNALSTRICVTFGTTIDQNRVMAMRRFLGPSNCSCASVVERLRTSDIRPTRRLVQAISSFMPMPDTVDCSVVADSTADAQDVSAAERGDNVMVLTWPLEGEENDSRLREFYDMGFNGVMTDDPCAMLRVLSTVQQGQSSPRSISPQLQGAGNEVALPALCRA